MSNLTFVHSGSFGDTIYGLNVVKLLGGGDLYVELNGMDRVSFLAWGSPDSGDHAGRYTEEDLEFMFPFLKTQSYLKNVEIYNNEPVDHDLRNHYKFVADKYCVSGKYENWQGNQTQCYAMVCDLDIHTYRNQLLLEPWLECPTPIKIPGKPVIINRTRRHIKRELTGSPINPQWMHWLTNDSLEEMAVFIGSREEHENFCQLHNCKVKYQPVSDMLEMARIIAGSEQFIGNQSMPLSLAIGLGKTFWCEVRVDYENIKTPHGYGDVWFPRVNGHYF